MNPGQQLMLADGVPAFLLMTAERRAKAWIRNPPRAMPTTFAAVARKQDPATIRLMAEMEANKKVKTYARIAAMLAKKNKPAKIDTTGLIWNQRYCRWDQPTIQEDDMAARITFQAFDKDNELLLRGCTSLPDGATPEQIEEKVKFCLNRARSAVNVSVTGIGGAKLGCWVVRDGALVRSDEDYRSAPMPKASVETPTVKKEVEVAKKVKAKKAAPAKKERKEKVAGEVRKGSKTEIVANLLKRKSGCTSAEVLAATGWPAVSMNAMGRACGLKIRKDKVKGEVTRYWGS